VFAREDCHHVSPDLVCRVAIRCNAIRADNDGINFSTLHHVTSHVVRDHGHGNVVFRELPRCKSKTLEKRSRLVRDHSNLFTGIARAANHAESGAVVAGSRECTRVAVCKHGGVVGDEWPTMVTDRAIGGDVFVEDGECFRDEGFLNLFDVVQVFVSFESRAHSFDGPEEIHGGRPSLAHDVADVEQVVFKIRDGRADRLARTERDSHCGRDADRGCAANHHLANGFRHFVIGTQHQVGFFGWQQALVQHAHAVFCPLDCFDHREAS